MEKLTLYKQLLSYIYPVRVRNEQGTINPILELYLYRGRWQLATLDAMYSDGVYYTPLVAAYKALAKELPKIKDVLVLGTGLGSAVQILAKKGYHPQFTLVDMDEKVLQWALELMGGGRNNIKPVCANAEDFIASDTNTYNLLIVDIFNGQIVPGFVTTEDFIKQCRRHLHTGGHWVFNYIVTDVVKWSAIRKQIDLVFPNNKVLELGVNRVVVATV